MGRMGWLYSQLCHRLVEFEFFRPLNQIQIKVYKSDDVNLMKMKAPHVLATVLTVDFVKTTMKNVLYVLTNMKNVARLARYSAQIFAIKLNWNVSVQNGVEHVNRLTDGAEQSANIQEISTLEISTLLNSLLLSPTDLMLISSYNFHFKP